MRRVSLALVLVVLGLLVAELVRRGLQESAPALGAADPTADVRSPVQEAPISDEGAARAHVADAAGESAREASSAREDSDAAPRLSELRGTYLEFDPWGRNRPVESGSFRISDDRDVPLTVAVEHGVWSAEVSGAAFEIGECTLGGERAQLHAQAPYFRVEPGRSLELVVRRRRPLSLRVVDAIDGRDLPLVSITRDAPQPLGRDWPGPALSRRITVSDASSPLALDALSPEVRDERLFVGARGYAWASVQISGVSGGEHWVALGRGGNLRVTLEGAEVPPNALVRIFDAKSSKNLSAVAPASSRELVFDALAPGEWLVRLDIGEPAWNSFTLVSERVTVAAGEQASVVLHVGELESARKVSVAGRLLLSGWGRPRAMRLYRTTPPRPGGADHYEAVLEAADGESCRWRVEALEPGAYDVYVVPPSTHFDLDVGADGRDDIEWRLPERALARVKLLDGDRGGLAEPIKLGWVDHYEPWRRGGQVWDVRRESGAECFEFALPAHEIALWFQSDGYAFQRVPWKLSPGTNERELVVHRACGLHVTVLDGDVPRSLGTGWDLSLRELDGTVCGFANPKVQDETEWIVAAPGPGRFRVHLEGLLGYREVAPIDVEVRPERFDPLVIELERVH